MRDEGLSAGWRKKIALIAAASLAALVVHAPVVTAQDDAVRSVEEKRIELKQKEEALKQEELRLNVLKKDVEEKIDAYTKLLAQVEAAVKKLDQARSEKIENVVKAYEGMAAEDAAARLSTLDDETALLIVTRMKSKKAGAVIALMEPLKAARLTRSMTMGPAKIKIAE